MLFDAMYDRISTTVVVDAGRLPIIASPLSSGAVIDKSCSLVWAKSTVCW